ncbi:MAG: DUF2834 domain-containing protein [Woeseia sp.]|nr:DUF2834 domain-containing protein [Woeseia sp.]MBT8096009.1 DUF2834 domain-containing protein [Woeseia sp.]NNE59511.1 DUF2834 domain-containing protein [Woeseia sp.]NNL54356.1 DUF2834 domain-containing protein [Woeseia sp.]
MNLKTLYLILALLGAIVPFVFFIQHIHAVGFGLADFIAPLFATGPSAGFTADLLISSLVFWIAILHERRRNNGPPIFLFVILNLCIGLSCALPAWLYARESRLATSNQE